MPIVDKELLDVD